MPVSTPLTIDNLKLQWDGEGREFYEVNFERVRVKIQKTRRGVWYGTLTTSNYLWSSNKCRLMIGTDERNTPEEILADLSEAVGVAKEALQSVDAGPAQKFYVEYVIRVQNVHDRSVTSTFQSDGPYDTESEAQQVLQGLPDNCHDKTVRVTEAEVINIPSRIDRLLEDDDSV